jgi:hypothetical protein
MRYYHAVVADHAGAQYELFDTVVLAKARREAKRS